MTGALRRSAVVVLALLASACGAGGFVGGGGETPEESRAIVVGSKGYTESIIVAKLYGEALAAHGYTVEYRHTLEAPDLLTPATGTTGIHIYPEYIGAADALLAPGSAVPTGSDASPAAQTAGALAGGEHAVLAVAPAGHSEGLAVTRATADELRTATISDLVAHSSELVFGAASDCAERGTCLPGLAEVYGLQFGRVARIDALGLRYQALVDGEIDVAAVVTTDPEIAESGLVVLVDDRGFFPTFHVAPVVDRGYLDVAPEDFEAIVNAVSARLSTSELAALNARVDIDMRDPTEVAIEWLRLQGITD